METENGACRYAPKSVSTIPDRFLLRHEKLSGIVETWSKSICFQKCNVMSSLEKYLECFVLMVYIYSMKWMVQIWPLIMLFSSVFYEVDGTNLAINHVV